MSTPARVGSSARALGFAGLLPQMFGTAAIAFARASDDPATGMALAPVLLLVLAYPLLILSFLGGMWWSFAMRREDGQARLAALAVAPSLVALALCFIAAVFSDRVGILLVATGCAILLTLPVDRHLVVMGEAPEGWMRLRMPLSLGLGGLTILAGALVG